MRYADYDEQVFMKHLAQKDAELMAEAKRIDDPLLRDVMYNMAQIVAHFADVEDENVLGASNRLEDEVAGLRENIPIVDDPEEKLQKLEDEVSRLERQNRNLTNRLEKLENKLTNV